MMPDLPGPIESPIETCPMSERETTYREPIPIETCPMSERDYLPRADTDCDQYAPTPGDKPVLVLLIPTPGAAM